MARISKGDEEKLAEFGLVFEDVPDVEITRRSKWAGVWEAAVELCQRHPGKSLKVRTYNNASSAYKDAKDINNGDSRNVPHGENDVAGVTWEAIATKTDEPVTEDSTDYKYAIYLTYHAGE